MATGYDTLQQAVTDAQSLLADAKALLVSLQNDATYVRQRSILNDPRVKADPRSWIDGSGVFWVGNDAQAAHAQGEEIVRIQDEKIAAQREVINDAQKTLNEARKALTDYEKNSPIGQAAATAAKDAGAKRSLIVTVVIIGIVVVVVSVVIFFVRKRKKNATA